MPNLYCPLSLRAALLIQFFTLCPLPNLSFSAQQDPSSKNETRVASLFGTWTGLTDLQTDIGKLSLKAHTIVHIRSDSMRVNTCSLPNCDEIDNKICQKPLYTADSTAQPACHQMSKITSDWSDASAFIYFGAVFDKRRMHVDESTGGWFGPYSVVLAQNKTAIKSSSGTPRPGDLVDKYTVKYVKTPSTPYLRMGPKSNVLTHDEFDSYYGPEGVQNTMLLQENMDSHHSFLVEGDYSNLYSKYYQTCANGQLKTNLPLLDFSFVVDEDGSERVDLNIAFGAVVTPPKGSLAYKTMGLLKRFLPISGPYCFGNDPKGAYMFNVVYDSTKNNKMVTFEQSCVEGLPCIPDEFEHIQSISTKEDNSARAGPVIIQAGSVLKMSLAIGVISILFLISMGFNVLFLTQRRRLSYDDIGRNNEGIEQIEYEQLVDEDNKDDISGFNQLKSALLPDSNPNLDGIQLS